MASFLEKTTSALNDPKESVTATAESVSASLTDAQKTVAASTETVKTDAATAPDKVFDESTQVRDAVDNALLRAVTNASGGASSSSTMASRDLPVSADNQPLLASGEREVETTTCWKEFCGVLELMAASNMRNGVPRR